MTHIMLLGLLVFVVLLNVVNYVDDKKRARRYVDTTGEVTITMGEHGDFAMGYNPGPDLYVSDEVVGGERYPDAECSICGLKEVDEIAAEMEEHTEDLYVSNRMWTEYKDKTYCGDCWEKVGDSEVAAWYKENK